GLPVDEGLDVRVIDVERDHLRGAAGGSARLDGASGAVADLEKAHEAGGGAAAGEGLALAADLAEVGAGAGAVLEDARLADPEVHDAATVDEVILDVLVDAGVRLRPGVGVGALDDLVRVGRVDVVVPLGRAGDAVGPGEAGVEPLRRVRGGHLHGHHVLQLVLERLG